MEMSFTKFTLLLKKNDETIEGQWIELDRFISFLRSYHTEVDKLKKIKRSNILTEFKGHINGLKEINCILHVSLVSALRYMFHHYDQQTICKEIVHKIQEQAFNKQLSVPSNIQEIYKRIINLSFRNPIVEKHIFKNTEFNENDIPFLYTEYKTEFTDLEWKKICYFEYHFSKRMSDIPSTYDYEVLLQKRMDFINEIETTNSLAKTAAKESQILIVERTKRKHIAAGDADISIHLKKKHSPKVIEAQILGEFCDIGINTVLCLDCVLSCKHNKSVHLYIELQQNLLEETTNIAEAISNFILNQHHLVCAEIFFLKQDTFLPYNDSSGKPCRFRFRDDLLAMKRNEDIFQHWKNENENEVSDIDNHDETDHEENCKSCFNDRICKPLSSQSFNILQEWTFDVPLLQQILLEKFININSIRKTENLTVLLHNKLTKLYTTYDILLNLFNRLYCGIIQEQNSQELALNYQSVSTVFSVTQGSGATLSLNESERRLKEMANEDLCHFNTYMKKYELEYETDAGWCKKKVNLKDCHLILLMDNLVRLKLRSDPCPGESRSQQLCTLPITLKGIPKDSKTVMSWHDIDCEGHESCNCKKDKLISREDFLQKLTQLTASEASMMKRFNYLSSWGFPVLWKSLFTGEAPDLFGSFKPASESQSLEESFASLQIEADDSHHENAGHDFLEEDGDKDYNDDDTIDYFDQEAFNTALDDRQFLEGEDIESLNNSYDDYEACDEFEIDNEAEVDSTKDMGMEDNEDIEDDMFVNNLLEEVEKLQIQQVNSFTFDYDDMDTFERINESNEGEETTNEIPEDLPDEDVIRKLILEDLRFFQFRPPALLTRHPPPATGRDDDLVNIRKVLDEILIKSEHSDENSIQFNKILFGPDNKIGNVLLKLIAQNKKYKIFLPEFPLLHLRKSKINTVCSAYGRAGILHILKYMRDDDYKEWKKLISEDHIEQASRYIRRLSLAFHIAFSCKYLQSLPSDERERTIEILADGKKPDDDFEKGYDKFLEAGMKQNATFCLHKEMMDHFDEISAISLAERLGGQDGYNLLLSAVKNSLQLAFLNGASSYAAYCVNLLYHHLTAGPFYQKMKCSLFTTPHKGSIVNIALDAQREMDHKDVLKGFRTGSTMSSILPRMSLIDTLNEASNSSMKSLNTSDRDSKEANVDKLLGIVLNKTDVKYILRVATLILRQDGLSLDLDDVPYNVYSNPKCQLPVSILDMQTREVGDYLIKKYVSTSGLFTCDKKDYPQIQDLSAPKPLIQKLKISNGVTIKRISSSNTQTARTEKEKLEQKRKLTVKRETKKIDCITSSMNACQAILKPDCTKPKVLKSTGIQKALLQLIAKSLCLIDKEVKSEDFIKIAVNIVPEDMKETVKVATVEFAGVKFKAKVFSGNDYVEFVKNYIIMKTIHQMPKLNTMVICEEKYHFTPDDFKAATRAQRVSSSNMGISHLKTVNEMISSNRFDKASLVSTSEGKSFISTYLARRVESIDLNVDLNLIIDSELNLENGYTIPIKCQFTKAGLTNVSKMSIKQSKGEAEMALVDWLMEFVGHLAPGDACASIVTSGDIDAVIIHLFSLSLLWPRNDDGTFKNTVYVVLQKAGGIMDIYNITKLIEVLESAWKEKYFAAKVAIGLSIGGNDFLPKFHNITHSKTLELFCSEIFRQSLVQIYFHNQIYHVKVDSDVYVNFVKYLYCSNKEKAATMSFEEVRRVTMVGPSMKKEGKVRNPQLWLPPASAIQRLAKNVQCLIDYYLTAGYHNQPLPDFIDRGCLKKTESGDIEFDLGEDAKISDIETIWQTSIPLPSSHKKPGKRKSTQTPQKGRRRKQKPVASTPKKDS